MTNVIYESNFSAKDTPEYFNTLNEAIAYTNEWADCTADFTPCVKKIIVVLDDFGQCIDHEEPECCWTMENPYVAEDCLEDADPELDDQLIDGESLLLESGLKLSFADKDKMSEFNTLCKEIGIVTGADLQRFAKDHDADDSNMLDKLRDYRKGLGPDFKLGECADSDITECSERPKKRPLPEDMAIEDIVEEMEENEDTVECTWCNDLFDKSECRYEVDLGWLCSRCEMAIKSRGETLTFREGNYWDFLDEAVDETVSKKKTWICYLNGRDVGTVEATTEEEAYSEMEKSWSTNNEDAQVVLAEDTF